MTRMITQTTMLFVVGPMQNPTPRVNQWCDLRTGPGLVLSIEMQNKKDEETQSVNLAIVPH